MNRSYEDLLSLTQEPPSFFQKDGVPRWAAFQPGVSTDVYADEAVTLEISCQACDARFHVLMERRSRNEAKTLADRILDGSIHYGDPPNVGCCLSGASMNTEPVRVLGYWARETWEWKREPSLEIAFRRHEDSLTDEMREKALAMIDDPNTKQTDIESLKKMLVRDEEDRASPNPEGGPVRYSEYREADACETTEE